MEIKTNSVNKGIQYSPAAKSSSDQEEDIEDLSPHNRELKEFAIEVKDGLPEDKIVDKVLYFYRTLGKFFDESVNDSESHYFSPSKFNADQQSDKLLQTQVYIWAIVFESQFQVSAKNFDELTEHIDKWYGKLLRRKHPEYLEMLNAKRKNCSQYFKEAVIHGELHPLYNLREIRRALQIPHKPSVLAKVSYGIVRRLRRGG